MSAEGDVRAYVCAYCASVGVQMRFCSVCRSTTYCSVACQKKDWKRHQLTCGQQPEGGADAAAVPEQAANVTPGDAAAAASTTTAASGASGSSAPQEAPQQLTHKESEVQSESAAAEGLFSTTNIIIGGAISVGLAVAGWFAYSYLGGQGETQRGGKAQQQQKGGRRPPQQRR